MQSALFQWRLCRDASACNASPGALELSLADYNAVLHLEQHNIDALYYRGTVFEKLGRLDEAISDFTAVLTLDPNHIKASYARGACRNLQGDFASAIEDYTYALERDKQPTKSSSRSRGSKSTSLREGLLSRHGPVGAAAAAKTANEMTTLSLSQTSSLASSEAGYVQGHDDGGLHTAASSMHQLHSLKDQAPTL
eukprot:GHRR01031801.1.p1 GENE.GHRR01031801.1~~GHRR01031801.1.p1  ORF type:complete len:195 (+),score=68.92 GHRR01031801.1:817-1401(+)